MDSESLPPIPTPPGQYWREFRIKLMPLVVFACVLAGMVLMWSNFVQPVSLVGQVETNSVNVVTTQAGLLTELALNRFDEVTNGQIIGQVELFDPEQLKAEIAALESADNVAKAKSEVLEWGKLDNAIQTRLNIYVQMGLLDTATVNYELASNIVVRDLDLMKPPNPVVTQAAYEKDLAAREALRKEVTNKLALVDAFKQELSRIQPMQTNVFSNLELAVNADIKYQVEQLRQLQKPMVLRAPISGKVTSVVHHAGERVSAGAAIVTISSSQATRIVAYVRQPMNYRPKLGDVVSVRTRTTRRRFSDAQIVKIGPQLEPISAIFLPMAKLPVELGLPIALALPSELDLLPGEIVDIKLSKN